MTPAEADAAVARGAEVLDERGCALCGQPVITHIGTGWLRDQLVHGECVLAVWLTGGRHLGVEVPA